jgi:DNA helicase-2/ATP-dependent DNA helicase PcrA
MQEIIDDNNRDNHVDETITNCLNINKLSSFFLFAGAGSGKTGSLVKALKKIKERDFQELQLKGQRVAIITYTNAACDEIGRRIDYDPLFSVSTIHSFIWSLVQGFNKDIKKWLNDSLLTQIQELEEQIRTGRRGTKTMTSRISQLEFKKSRLQNLSNIKKFTYNPNGLNLDSDSLSHAEVISVGTYFLNEKLLLQRILINKYPILLIDESQDTNKNLMDAFLMIEQKNSGSFALGLFGDIMQRIYSDGKIDLGNDLPLTWMKPAKVMNHRCSPRIVKLINKIRETVDNQKQRARMDREEGYVRMFILPSTIDKNEAEKLIIQRMKEITQDQKWVVDSGDYTTLILEHHMAAKRLGFLDFFKPLYENDKLKTGVLDGTITGLSFFAQVIIPLVAAHNRGDKMAIARVVRDYSPLLKVKSDGSSQIEYIRNTEKAVDSFLSLWNNGNDPKCIDVLRSVLELNLFNIPQSLSLYINKSESEDTDESDTEQSLSLAGAWEECLNAPFSQVIKYDTYVSGKSKYMTHQGVKGLEFPRVVVIIDDSESRGFLFSYEKLFGAKEKTQTDLDNEVTGKDTTISRTKRLFYVTCSRAEKSLAIIAYSDDPKAVRQHVISEEWFDESEVELIN